MEVAKKKLVFLNTLLTEGIKPVTEKNKTPYKLKKEIAPPCVIHFLSLKS